MANEIITIPTVHDTLIDTGSGDPGDGVTERFCRFGVKLPTGTVWWIVDSVQTQEPQPAIIHGRVRVSAASLEPAVALPMCRSWECHFTLVYPSDSTTPYYRFSDLVEVGPDEGPEEDTPPTIDLSEFESGLIFVVPGRWIGNQTRWFATVESWALLASDVTGLDGD